MLWRIMDMPICSENQRLYGMGQLIVHENLLDRSEALRYQNLALTSQQSLLEYLVANTIFPASSLALIIAKHYALPLIDLDCIDLDSISTWLVNEKLIHRHRVVPLFIHAQHLLLATDDPGQQNAFKEIEFHTGLQAKIIVVEADKLSKFIDKILYKKENRNLLASLNDRNAPENNESNLEKLNLSHELAFTSQDDDAPIIKFVNQTILEAIKKGASDIHFEPYENEFRIRYRLDGILTEVTKPPINLSNRICSRIKVMSNLDISERRLPQDGRFQMKLALSHTVDFRVSSCPTVNGEKVVIRILDTDLNQLDIEALGFNPLQKKQFLTAIEKPQGLILITGPTGSGKTVSLYTALSILNTKEKNISTAEDPVEIKIKGINQVNINPKAGLNFANILRSFLRQDPDIIMVGEIRDLETAEIAIKAAHTGHLVLSTLHTNSAAETLTRLINIGIPAYNIANSVSLLVAQRLARQLCETCKVQRDDLSVESLIALGFSESEARTVRLYKAVGCEQCTNGYLGRIGLFEVMPISKKIGQLLMSGGNSLDILKQAQADGMLTIYQSGLEKVKQGLTTFEDLNRVTVD